MSIRITCSCGTTAVVSDEYAGKIGKCRRCNATIVVGVKDDAAPSSGEEAALANARGTGDVSPSTTPSAGLQNPRYDPDSGAGTSDAVCENETGPSSRESSPGIEDAAPPLTRPQPGMSCSA